MNEDMFAYEPDESEREIEALRLELSELLGGFADEHDMDSEFLAMLLLDAAIGQRGLAYVLETAKPSESGLKLELDRMNRAFSEMVRDARKEAGTMLKNMVDTLRRLESEGEDDA